MPELESKLNIKGILLRCETKSLELRISIGKEIVERIRLLSENLKSATEKIRQLRLFMEKGLERCEEK